MDSLLADLRYGLRLVRKSPVFSLITIGTLALGIGANAAIYSVFDAVLLRPLPYSQPDRLMMVWEESSDISFPRNTPAPANYFSWKERSHAFSDLAATRSASANLTLSGPPELVIGRRVTANFFDVLGVRPLLGRTFTDDEDRTGATVTLISYGLWQRRYAGNADIVGSDVMMNGSRRTIIGVMPRDFVFRARGIDFWSPIQFTPAEIAMRGSHFLNVVARLAPGATLEQARKEMNGIAADLTREFPNTNTRVGAVVIPLKEDVLGATSLQLIVLMAAAGSVLLIACANIAGLLLTRSIGRRTEMAVRAALGATSPRLVRQLIVESLILAAAGALLGVALVPVGQTLLAALVPGGLMPVSTAIVNGRLLGFLLVLTIGTALLCSLFPAAHTARASLRQTLQEGGRSRIGGRTVTRDALVVAQVAAALALLVAAGLLVRTMENLRSIELGFPIGNLLTLRTTLPLQKYQDPAMRLAFYERVIAGVRALPGVENAGYVSTLPFMSPGNTRGFVVEGRGDTQNALLQDALFRVGTADYLKTLGVQLLEGRLLDRSDDRDHPWAVVINETFARAYWPGESPLGRRVRFAATEPWRTVVGVVKDVRERGHELEMKPGVYTPYAQELTTGFPENLLMRTTVDPVTIAPAARRIVAEADADQPVSAVRTMQEIVDLDVADRTDQTRLVGAFAGLALLLAAIGLYGVLSYGVSQRAREIGLRMALGATAASVTRLVIGRGLGLTLTGLVIGLALAWASARSMTALLYGVPATDPITFASVATLLVIVALVACSVPAVRAARVDPIAVLRQD